MNNYRKYLQGHLKEVAREEKELEQKAGLAREKAGEIARQLARRFGVTKVCLFGSLAAGDFDQFSDIDLAVAGLPEREYLKAYGLAEEIARPFAVDLVLLENAVETLKERVQKEGIVLYDRQGEESSPLKTPDIGNK
ncbi:nucleotidyltransferase family protein [Desulfofundulus thermosubterraneus]|uniref:Predicted nucleotidyltransferase n=1 Tax=Desulfofundulus thermosubterraneus DSM 16057 TaxID=1121432 RepID=A0A1M6K3R1_9FIRM|nr:nucleotidyltransferase domain-containing protein [Desulfofundulus thermosubterraneus]SHJ53586.1 Predicted nucleotidyltransferase [Desulfofundulus thermosubterraneus DSM 16057]